MDPVTQGALGAAAAINAAPRRRQQAPGYALLLGIAGGMAPDLDVLIRSSADPLLFLEYHRHFSHSLFFIPLGGALVGLVLHALIGRRHAAQPSSMFSIGFATAGYATHALLDACTTYGTLLLWPLSDQRFAWNTVSVIDPLYTLPILVLLLLASVRGKLLAARLALAWIVAYPMLGALQRDRAEAVGHAMAEQRGHPVQRLEAKPSFGNILLWKIVYDSGDRFYVDAVRMGWTPRYYAGGSVARLNVARDFPWLSPEHQQFSDVERFRWFSNDYLAVSPSNPEHITDIRYSMVPNRIQGLWSIRLSPATATSTHARYLTHRDSSTTDRRIFLSMLLGRDVKNAISAVPAESQ